MKKICFSLLAIVLLLNIVSCSDQSGIEILDEPFLKEVKLTRNSAGNYVLEYELTDNSNSDRVDVTPELSEIHLSRGNHKGHTRYIENWLFKQDYLEISFIDNNHDDVKLKISDDQFLMAKGGEFQSNQYLSELSITKATNEDVVNIDFRVEKNVEVTYDYNKEDEIYEIHLFKSENPIHKTDHQLQISLEDAVFRLDFCNHYGTVNAQSKSLFDSKISSLSSSQFAEMERKPRVIMSR